MKRALALALPLVIFISLVAGLHDAKVAEANFVPSSPSIIFDSPLENRTYTTNSIWLNITLKTWFDPGNASRIVECSLDGKENITIPLVSEVYEDTFSTVTGSLLLSDLSEGFHRITVYATNLFLAFGDYSTSDSKTINFLIELPEPAPSPESQIEPLPSSLVFTASVGTALLALGLLAYLKQRKR
jgi:hypothetical protein